MKDYSEWVLGMRHRPTIFDAEEVLKKDYPLKLPDRRYIHMYNSPELSQFRGVQTNLNDFEEKQAKAGAERTLIQQIGREQGHNTVDITAVAETIKRQEQQMGAMQQHYANLAAINRAEAQGRHNETISELERLNVAQRDAANRARVAEEMTNRHRDTMMEDRDRMAAVQGQVGGVVNNIDNRHIDSSTHITQNMTDASVHNQVMHLIRTHHADFGAFAHQQNMTNEQMMRLVHQHVANQPQPVIHYFGANQRPDEAMVQYTGESQPPPPPGAGAVVAGGGRTDEVMPQQQAPQAQGPASGPPGPPGPPGGGGDAIPTGRGAIRAQRRRATPYDDSWSCANQN